jgi:adenosine kinase
MSALICGSLAYDTIMVFPDQFKNHILPDKVHILNVSFPRAAHAREFGGCAGNIAYNLKLLGGEPIPMATVGQDFGPYRDYFTKQGIRLDHVREVPELFTAQAFITTDLDNNQITAFHPGAMMRSFENHVRDVKGVTFGIVAPDGREAMLQNAAEFAERGIPFIFDPGQAMPLFNGDEFRPSSSRPTMSRQRLRVELLQERTGWSEREIARRSRLYHDAGPARLHHVHRFRRALRHSACARAKNHRSHRLRRRLSRGADLRPHARLRPADLRPHGLIDGRLEDRASRYAEPALHLRRVRRPVPAAVRLRAVSLFPSSHLTRPVLFRHSSQKKKPAGVATGGFESRLFQ